MPVGEAMFTQRAIRRFKPDPIPDAHLKLILDAASKAPSGGTTLHEDVMPRVRRCFACRTPRSSTAASRWSTRAAGSATRFAGRRRRPPTGTTGSRRRPGRSLASDQSERRNVRSAS
ncbi:MAG: hypothetical protein FJ144_21025 [Deltaproteobacteria bacterium]|nr:hypothetical protein [Deltaproteobacteria bacterium]